MGKEKSSPGTDIKGERKTSGFFLGESCTKFFLKRAFSTYVKASKMIFRDIFGRVPDADP